MAAEEIEPEAEVDQPPESDSCLTEDEEAELAKL